MPQLGQKLASDQLPQRGQNLKAHRHNHRFSMISACPWTLLPHLWDKGPVSDRTKAGKAERVLERPSPNYQKAVGVS